MKKVAIKICGITNEADAFAAAQAGAQYLGYILNYPPSPRSITAGEAKHIIQRIRQIYPAVQHVGVFVNADPDQINQIITQLGLDVVQLHGDETMADLTTIKNCAIWKTVLLRAQADLERLHEFKKLQWDSVLSMILLDSGHGSGQLIDPILLNQISDFSNIALAGGITSANVHALVERYQPAIIDVSSGVEAVPGKKDFEKLKALFYKL